MRIRAERGSGIAWTLSVAIAVGAVAACGGGDPGAVVPFDARIGGAGDGASSGGGDGGGAGDAASGSPDAPATDDGGAPSDDSVLADASSPPDAAAAPNDLAGGAPDLVAGKLLEHVVAPKATDPAIDKWLDNHYAYLDTRVAPRPELVLYLAGAGGTPAGTVAMLKELAGYGFHVVGVRYCNDYLIVDLCNQDPDPDCHGKLRLEALDGMDHSPHIVVTPPNGIESRLGKLLAYLDAKFPSEGWGHYLANGGAADWSKVIVGGISHGASAAGRISKVRPLARAVMLSGPYDSKAGVPAKWTTETPTTPPDRVFAFSHTSDGQEPQHLEDWASMMLPGAPASVDGKQPPFAGSHRLLTSNPSTKDGHSSTAAGGASPQVNGVYVFRPVWRYLFGP